MKTLKNFLGRIYDWMTHSILLFVLQIYTWLCILFYFYFGFKYSTGDIIFLILMCTPITFPYLFSTVIFDIKKWKLPFNYSWIFPFTFIPTAIFIGEEVWYCVIRNFKEFLNDNISFYQNLPTLFQ